MDVRYLGLFFALQLFHYKAKSNIDARDKTPWIVNIINSFIKKLFFNYFSYLINRQKISIKRNIIHLFQILRETVNLY